MFHVTFNEKTKIWSGASTIPVFNKDLSVGAAFLDALQKNPNKIGQVYIIQDKKKTLF